MITVRLGIVNFSVLFFSQCRTTFAFLSLPLDPNALAGQTGPDHALIGGIVAVVVFVTLCSIILLGRYLARHKGRTHLVEVQSLLEARQDFTWECHSLSPSPPVLNDWNKR